MNDLSAPVRTAAPQPGDVYELSDASPWPHLFRYRVLEVRDGWVRYVQLDERTGEPLTCGVSKRPINLFGSVFTKVTP